MVRKLEYKIEFDDLKEILERLVQEPYDPERIAIARMLMEKAGWLDEN